jgi:hypothetical protein
LNKIFFVILRKTQTLSLSKPLGRVGTVEVGYDSESALSQLSENIKEELNKCEQLFESGNLFSEKKKVSYRHNTEWCYVEVPIPFSEPF